MIICLQKGKNMAEIAQIVEAVQKFFEAFSKLSPDEKRFFLSAIDKEIKAGNKADKDLYLRLIKAAKEGESAEKVIEELKAGNRFL